MNSSIKIEAILRDHLRRHHILAKKHFNWIAILIGTMVFISLAGLINIIEMARKRLENCCLSEESGSEVIYVLVNVSFLNRRIRKLWEYENLPPIPRCICEYYSFPPEERYIRWCSYKNNDYRKKYPVDQLYIMVKQNFMMKWPEKL